MAMVAGRGTGRSSDERRFFARMALAIAAFVGFAPSYCLAGFFAGPRLSLLVHLQGAVFTLWMLVYIVRPA